MLYGSAVGVDTGDAEQWTQNSPGILDTSEAGDSFGAALAAGDFNGDLKADLIIGAPNENVGAVADAGAANVIYGSAAGLSEAGDQFWHQNSPGVIDVAEAGDNFAAALTAADFNGDGFADAVFGVPKEDIGATTDAGAVCVLYGSALGISQENTDDWTQNSPGVLDVSEVGDNFGAGVAGMVSHADGLGWLVIGVPMENVGAISDAGAGAVLYGTPAGLSEANDQFWHQNSP